MKSQIKSPKRSRSAPKRGNKTRPKKMPRVQEDEMIAMPKSSDISESSDSEDEFMNTFDDDEITENENVADVENVENAESMTTFAGISKGIGSIQSNFKCSKEAQRIADVVVAMTYVTVYLFPGAQAVIFQALLTFLRWFGFAGQAAALVVSTGAAAVQIWSKSSLKFLKSAALSLTSTALQKNAPTTTWIGFLFGKVGISESGEVDFVKLLNTIKKIPGFIIARNSVCVVIENALPEETRMNWSTKIQYFTKIETWMDALFTKKKLWEITAVGSDASRNEKQMALLKKLAVKATSEYALKEAMKTIDNAYKKNTKI